MANEKVSGGARKIGRNKSKYAKYYSEDRRSKHKLKRFIKNNIGKLWDDKQINSAISKFKDMQYKKRNKHKVKDST